MGVKHMGWLAVYYLFIAVRTAVGLSVNAWCRAPFDCQAALCSVDAFWTSRMRSLTVPYYNFLVY